MSTSTPTATLEALSRLARRIAPRSVKEAIQALDALGVEAKPIREDRSIVGYTLHLPPEAPLLRALVIRKPDNYKRFSPEGLWFGYYQHTPREQAVLAWLRDAARAAGAAADPAGAHAQAREQQGLPLAPRSKDSAVRTCGACFRDIKATAADRDGRDTTGKRGGRHRLIADHGYSIDPGWRSGACWGVGHLPLEESPEALRLALEAAIEHADSLRRRIHQLSVALRSPAKAQALGPRQVGTGKLARDPQTGKRHEVLVNVEPDDPRWRRSVQIEHDELRRALRALWSGGFLSIPWLRAALREWTPQAPTVTPARGAPLVSLVPRDYAGRPPEATR